MINLEFNSIFIIVFLLVLIVAAAFGYSFYFTLTFRLPLHLVERRTSPYVHSPVGELLQQYIGNTSLLRIAKAVELLRTTNLSITEIAASVGFNQLSNFGKVFRENTNYTPREYRKLARE